MLPSVGEARRSPGVLLAYGGFAMPLSLAGLPILAYMPAFYAQELQLSAGLVGLVFLLARLWDAVSNPLFGWLSDRTRTRWGRRKPWVIIGAPFLMASTWFLCNPPAGAGLGYLAFWAAVFYTIWVGIYVPYVSWGTELASDYTERSRVASYREIFTMFGNLFFAVAPILFLAEGAPLREVLRLIALSVLIGLPIAVLPLVLWVRDQAPVERVQTHFASDLAAVVKDRVLLRFLFAILCFMVGEGVVASLFVFYLQVGVGLPTKLFWAIFILYVVTIAVVPLLLWAAKRVEKHRLLAAAMAMQVVLYVGFVLIPSKNFPIFVVLTVALGVAHSVLLALPTSIVADIVDHGDLTSGKRRAGAYVAAYSLTAKLGLALGVGLAFSLLALVNFVPSAAHHSAENVSHIRLLAFGLPALLQVPAAFLFFSHPITRQKHADIQQGIMRRDGTPPALASGSTEQHVSQAQTA